LRCACAALISRAHVEVRAALRLAFTSVSPRPPPAARFPYTTLFRSPDSDPGPDTLVTGRPRRENLDRLYTVMARFGGYVGVINQDRKSTRLNSSHVKISYAVFCLRKKSTSVAHSGLASCVSLVRRVN